MLTRRKFQVVVCLPLVLALSTVCVLAQQTECSSRSFNIWLNCEVAQVAGARLNQQATNKQPETPSLSGNSTSLVDQTAAPDLFGMALNLAGLAGDSKDEDSNQTAFTFTTSAYALYAAALQHDPLDPAFYRRHPNLRRFYFSVGQETPEGEEPTDENRATLLGFKFLIINRRDVSLASNRALLETVFRSDSGAATVEFSRTAREIEDYLYMNLLSAEERTTVTSRAFVINQLADFPTIRGQITDAQLSEIRRIIARRIASRVALEGANIEAIEKIRKAPQLAFTFNTKQRKEDGTDEYRAGLAFDYGLRDRVGVTLNASFDYADSKLIGADTRGGRISGDANFKLTRDRNPFGGTGPYIFTVSGEGKWMNNQPSTVTGQAKLTIPIFDGVSLPISVSVANRSELIKETTVRGRVGFSFDFTKLLTQLR